MAITVSSTTDDQAAVNAAAGIAEPEAPEAARHPEKEKPQPTPAPEPEEDEEPGEEPPAEEGEKPKPKGGFQRKIERLERALEYEREARQRQEYEYRMRWDQNGRAQPQQSPQQQPQQPAGPPRQEQYETYEQYIDALTDHKLEQALAKRTAIERERRQQEAQQQRVSGWQQRVGQFKTTTADFDDAMDAVSHIPIPPVLEHALMSSEDGPKLAYELARHPDMLETIVRLEPLAQLRALGKFEASLGTAPAQAAPPRRPVSQAPEPIRPVGQGAANGSTVPLDQLPLRDYIARRNRELKARRSG